MRLGMATVIGMIVGTDRELRGKPAGLRTHGLVALGASLVTFVTIQLGTAGGLNWADSVSRAIQGIIAGVGFLGGGAILKSNGQAAVTGLTTAASIWVVASLGIACGAGLWQPAIAAVILTLGVLVVGGPVESIIRRLFSRPMQRFFGPPEE